MVIVSQADMITSRDVLLLNPTLCPPHNAHYGARTNGFVLSHIHHFGGKPWQLRSVRVRGGDHHVLPFVINSGGSTWDTPIIGEPALEALGIRRDEAAVVDRPHDDIFELPNLLGRIRRPLVLEWHRSHDIRMNLLGHELALAIAAADRDAQRIKRGRQSRAASVECLTEEMAAFGATTANTSREIDALLAAPLPDEGRWTCDTLPLAPSALA